MPHFFTTPTGPLSAATGVDRRMVLTRTWLLGTATVATGLMAGFFYTYSCSVMLGLDLVGDRAFIDTMQSINATVRNPWFGISFFGALLLTAASVLALLHRSVRSVLPWAVAGFVLYLIAFGITMGISVPLNEELAAAGDPAAVTDPAAVRAAYEGDWNSWNLNRALAAIAAFACMIRALIVHSRASATPDAHRAAAV